MNPINKINRLKMGLGASIIPFIEGGAYYDFRDKSTKESITSSNPTLLNLMLSALIFFSYELPEEKILALQMNLGLPGLFSPSLILNTQNYMYWFSWVPSDIKSSGVYNLGSIAFGVNVKLNDQ